MTTTEELNARIQELEAQVEKQTTDLKEAKERQKMYSDYWSQEGEKAKKLQSKIEALKEIINLM